MNHGHPMPGLHALARLHGIQTSYRDVNGRRTAPPDETLVSLLRSLGESVENASECREALRAERLRRCEELVQPVLVAWDGVLSPFDVLARAEDAAVHLSLAMEDGAARSIEETSVRVDSRGGIDCEGQRYHSLQVHLDVPLPPGYHSLTCRSGGRSARALVVSAPLHVFGPSALPAREWGVFLPLYALRSSGDWGTGSYADLARLADWTAHLRGHTVGTLPLLPCFLGASDDPSPYRPISRLLWSEFFTDIESVPNLPACTEALALLQSPGMAQAREALRRSPTVDYAAVWQVKRTVLEALSRHAWSSAGRMSDELERFLRDNPVISDYAAFRAEGEAQTLPWRRWSPTASDGDLSRSTFDPAVRRFYEFAQWAANLQMSAAARSTEVERAGLYLDLPLGVHPDGYDAWRHRQSFLGGVSCGAPPDLLFTTGQDWGSPPPHPVATRRRGYDYFRAAVAHHMGGARALRIDHVMGLHRVFCIPAGHTAAEGTYLRYHPEELYAIVSLASHRHRTVPVGEDLGMVPREVRQSMARHRLTRMFVLHYEMEGITDEDRLRVPENCLASINTHDMPPFASMWNSLDIPQQVVLGILKRDAVFQAEVSRNHAKAALMRLLRRHGCGPGTDAEPLEVLRCVLQWLGSTRARHVLVNLEDLWLETQQPNVPGIGAAYPSWRHKAAVHMEAVITSPQVLDLLDVVRRARGRNGSPTGEER